LQSRFVKTVKESLKKDTTTVCYNIVKGNFTLKKYHELHLPFLDCVPIWGLLQFWCNLHFLWVVLIFGVILIF